MIAACPRCEARYRIEREKLGAAGVRLRCSKCQAVFRVRAPSSAQPPRSVAPPEVPLSAAASPNETPPPAAAPSSGDVSMPPAGSPPAGSPSHAELPTEEPPLSADAGPVVAQQRSAPQPAGVAVGLDSAGSSPPGPDAPLVLVGTPDEDVGKTLREALESWGLRAVIVADGVDTMLEIQRQQPAVVILASTLPRMYGFQVCEMVKRNESLQRIGVVLLGAIHHPDRYRRPPTEIYGADAYVEEPDLPEALLPELRQLGIFGRAAETGPPPAPDVVAPPPEPPALTEPQHDPVASGATDTAASVEPPAAVPCEPPRAPTEMAAPGAADELFDARAQAERLARIIVSDIVLYNEEKFAVAIEARTVVESLGPDLEEGRGLFRDRIDARIRDEKDYLTEELLRVARTRGMQ